LYREHLLEDDHFLDWILRCLESCASERLFLWLLVGSLYAADLTASRRRGKQFAESLLYHADKVRLFNVFVDTTDHLQLFDNEEDGQTSPILEYIEKLLMKLLVSCPSSLLLPRNWDKHRAILQRLAFKHPHPLVVHAVESLERRNFRIMHSPTTNSGNPQNPVKRAMGLLDAVDFNVGIRIEKLANDCMDLISDGRELISTVLRWASSVYRDGLHRVYLATRLLRKWSCFGADIDDGVLSYLCSTDRHLEDELCYIFRIVSELVRSKTFSVGKYLQWLIATGSLPHSLNISSVRILSSI
jgi:mediator of RNA polymerase II transcription subunit 12